MEIGLVVQSRGFLAAVRIMIMQGNTKITKLFNLTLDPNEFQIFFIYNAMF